jgi:hypothetical protein
MVNSGGTLNTTAITWANVGSSVTLPLSLASGGLGAALSTPGADSGYFYDLSAGMSAVWTPTLPLAFSGTGLVLDIVNTTGATADRGDKVVFADISNGNAIRMGTVSDMADLAHPTEAIAIKVTGETTAVAAGTNKVRFRMPYAFTVTAVRASLNTAQTSGSILTIDINESGTTIISTKLTIDNTEKTSTTAATPAVISDSSLADDAEIGIDVDQIGDGTAAGLTVYLIGHQT